MAKKEQMIMQQNRGRVRDRGSSAPRDDETSLKATSQSIELNKNGTATDSMSEAVLESEKKVTPRIEPNSTVKVEKPEGSSAEKTLSLVIKLLAFFIILIVLVIIFTVVRQNKITRDKYAKVEEYTQYIDGYFQVMNEANIDVYQGYFDTNTKIAEEYEYFQDGVHAESSKKLLGSLLSTVSIQYNTAPNGMKDVSETSNVTLSYIDYNALKQIIFEDASSIKLGVKDIKTGTPKDRQIIKTFILENLSEYVSESNVRVQESAIIDIVNTKVDKVSYRYLDSSIDEKIYSTVLKSEGLVAIFDLYYDIIRGDIKKGEDFETYEERMDKKYIEGGKSRESYVEEYIYDVDYKAENGISKLVGEGTLDKPASISTEVESVYKATVKTKKGYKTKKCKVLVSVDKAYVGEDAIAYANSLDARNRGLTLDLTGTIMILDVSIKNLTKEKFNIVSNFGVVDEYGNLFYSTGKIYGMRDTASLKKYGTAKMQYYILCDTLDTKTLIYGADFNKKIPYVYFNTIQEYVSTDEN